MNTIIVILNILIPLLMISIGILFNVNSSNKANKILEFIVPIAMLFSGVSPNKTCSNSKNEASKSLSTKCSFLWIISGSLSLITSLLILVIYKCNFNVCINLIELEFCVLVFVFITAHYFIKNNSLS